MDKIKKLITESPTCRFIMNVLSALKRIKEAPYLWGFLLAVLILLVIIFLPTGYNDDDKGLTGSARFIRDFIVLMIACSGLYIAGIRSHAADKQAKAANKQAETDSKRQSAETFAKSVELLASNNRDGKPAIESRIGGIYALEKLASADADNYAAPVMKMLVTYIQENAQKTALPVASKESEGETTTDWDKRKKPAHLGKDVKTAFAALKRLHDSVLNKSGLKRESPDELSFAYADFRALRMNEIKWIDKPDLRYAQLQSVNLSEAKLQDAELSWAQLQGAKLLKVQLQGAVLFRAQLQGADLREAQLQSVDLRVAELQSAVLSGAELQDANLSGAELQDANLIKTKLQSADLDWAQLQGADLSGAQLQGAGLSGAELQDADLRVAELQGVNLRRAQLQDVNLDGAELQGANLHQAELKNARLQNIKVEYTSFEHAKGLQPSNKNTDNIQNWKVWHSDQPFFIDNKVASLKDDSKWDLKPILKDIPKESQKAFLQGVLRNFAEKDKKEPAGRARQCRLAVRKLQKSHPDLWNALDTEWTEWLEELDEDGLSPDERKDDE